MVFKRKLGYLSVGFDFPNIPRAPRSCRRKVLKKRTDDDTQICAIDLLALAGKLIQECESSSVSSNAFEGNNHNNCGKEIKQEREDKCKPVKSESSDQGNSVSKPTYENTSEKCVVNSFTFPDSDGILERTPMSDNKKIHGLKAVGCENKIVDFDFYAKSGGITGETGDVDVNTGFQQGETTNRLGDGGLITNTCKLDDATALGLQFPNSVYVGGDLKSPSSMYMSHMTPNGSFAKHGNHINLGRRDDDEKFYSYHKLSNRFKSYRSPNVRRIRKSMSSKYWKQVPKELGHIRADVGVKALYCKRKSCYGYNSWQRDIIYKRRSSDRSSVVTSDGGLSSGSVSKLPENGETVKLSIKSFRIPELLIEVPETATVGSLKRTVMEAVSVLLSGGIRVGVLMQGKKVRDDRKTLSQTGISSDENLGSLGFTLEPCPSKVPVPLCSEDSAVPIDPMNFPERSTASPLLDSGIPCKDGVISSGNTVDNNLELVPYQSDMCVDVPSSDSKALVPLPAPVIKALAIVPLNQKPKRTELAQRRTRRPFSVTEVEALVQAVEELGTGRWRDVKLRAFENADHRTYVDLKDKWKTLVHTASISPQQRRGEPVPQELLDRVLRAYGYWSQHQGKHQARGTHKDPDMRRARALESGVSM